MIYFVLFSVVSKKARKSRSPAIEISLPTALPIRIPEGIAIEHCSINQISIRTTGTVDICIPTTISSDHAPFSYTATLVTDAGESYASTLITAKQRVSDVFAENAHAALNAPEDVYVSFDPVDDHEVVTGAPSGSSNNSHLWDALLELGLVSKTTSAANDDIEKRRQQAISMIELALKLGHGPLVRDYILAGTTNEGQSYSDRQGSSFLLEVNNVYTWTIETCKTQVGSRVQKLCHEKIIPILIGKRPAVVPVTEKSTPFTTEIPVSLVAEIQSLLYLTLGLLSVCDGLHERKTQQVEATSRVEDDFIQKDLHRSLDELLRHKLETRCMSQILMTLEVVLVTPGLSLYPLLPNKSKGQKGKESAYSMFKEEKLNQYKAAAQSWLPDEIHVSDVNDNNINYSGSLCLFDELIQRIEPKYQNVCNLPCSPDANKMKDTISAFFMLPLRHLNHVALREKEREEKKGTDNQLGSVPISMGASPSDNDNLSSSGNSVESAADSGHAIVHHTLLDLFYLCMYQDNTRVDVYQKLSVKLQRAMNLPRSLGRALVYLWKIDTKVDVSKVVCEIGNIPEIAEDRCVLESIMRRLLIQGEFESCRVLLQHLAHNHHLRTEYGAICRALAVPYSGAWQYVWNDARRCCDSLTGEDKSSAILRVQHARQRVANVMIRWAVGSSELQSVLESPMVASESSEVEKYLIQLATQEQEGEGQSKMDGSHSGRKWKDVLVLWLLHYGKTELAKYFNTAVRDQQPGMEHESISYLLKGYDGFHR